MTQGSRLAAALLALLLVGCTDPRPTNGRDTAATGSARLRVYTVNYPLAYFAKRIGGDRVEVAFPAPADVDPAFWSPEPEAINAYQQADLILLNGAAYARWVDRVALPPSKLLDTGAQFRDELIPIEGAAVHSHGPQGEHSHGEVAHTTWLDPNLATAQARSILAAFRSARPAARLVFDNGFAELEAELLEVDRRLTEISAASAGRPLVGSHPVYQYLARRYDLNLASVHFEPHEYPDAEGWEQLERLLADHRATVMLWEGTPLERSVSRLRDLGLTSVVVEPGGNRPASGDLLTMFESNLRALEQAFDLPAGD